ncbi:MAG: hypothetical protein F6J93_12925 [Oscillatoria sp. SIO1A7]|nr:hypothetical protein [Oscillatoria sp. SIO1A7]
MGHGAWGMGHWMGDWELSQYYGGALRHTNSYIYSVSQISVINENVGATASRSTISASRTVIPVLGCFAQAPYINLRTAIVCLNKLYIQDLRKDSVCRVPHRARER